MLVCAYHDDKSSTLPFLTDRLVSDGFIFSSINYWQKLNCLSIVRDGRKQQELFFDSLIQWYSFQSCLALTYSLKFSCIHQLFTFQSPTSFACALSIVTRCHPTVTKCLWILSLCCLVCRFFLIKADARWFYLFLIIIIIALSDTEEDALVILRVTGKDHYVPIYNAWIKNGILLFVSSLAVSNSMRLAKIQFPRISGPEKL